MNADTNHSGLSASRLMQRLHRDEFFSLFTPAETERLLNKATSKRYQAGAMIYNRGDDGAFMGIVTSGRLRMTMTAADGRGILIGLVEAGALFGETTILDGLPRTTDAEAESDVTAMILWRDDFMNALQNNPKAMYGMITMLCHRLRHYLDTIDLIGLQNVPQRLARHLLRLAEDYGVEDQGHMVIRAGLNQASLGQQLATSRESINKQLRQFTDQGYVRLSGKDIVLLDQAALNALAY